MNPARLLEHFNRIAEASDAIPRLRRFILDLAVRGNLVEQDPNDEPASELLKKIQHNNFKFANKIKRRIKTSSDLELGHHLSIPSNWVSTPFGNVVAISTGKLDANAAVPFGRYPFFTCSRTPLRIDKYSFDTSAVLLAGNGDFNVKYYNGQFDAYQRTYVIEPRGWSLRYCYIVVKSQIDRITNNHRGSAIPYLTLSNITDPEIPLPPLAEQHRIVAKVDELMALCDRLEATQAKRESRRDRLASASLKRISQPEDVGNGDEFRENVRFHLNHLPRLTTKLEHIKELRQTILNLAVRGKLVPQDPNDEPAAELLKRIQAERAKLRREKRAKKYQPLPQINKNGTPFSVPKGWQWERFIEVAAIQSNLVDPGDFHASPHIAPDNIESRTGRLLPFDTIGNSAVFSPKHLFSSGCILYSKIRPALAKVVIVNFDGLCSADMYPIIPFINREYLFRFMLSEVFVRQSVSEDNRVAMPKINQASLSKILVAVPPLAEQYRIVTKVGELMALCDQLEVQINTAQADRSRLLEATLCEALGVSKMPIPRAGRTISSRATPVPRQAERPLQAAKPRLVEPAHTPPQRSVVDQPKPALGSRPQSAPDAILARMKPGHDYSRAQLCDALGLSVYEWNMAIRALKENGQVIQTGEKRGARYRLPNGR